MNAPRLLTVALLSVWEIGFQMVTRESSKALQLEIDPE